jgi:hypothetical protein
MKYSVLVKLAGLMLGAMLTIGQAGAADGGYKPYILGIAPVAGSLDQVAAGVRNALKAQGFEDAGSYSPYAGAMVIVFTSPELKAAAAANKYGGFGAGIRIALTEHKGKLQVSYINPAYMGSAYGIGPLAGVSAKLEAALGRVTEFGSEIGRTAEQLAPGVYHYMVGMPYFNQVDVLASYPDYATAVKSVEAGLAAGKGGTKKVYRIDLPGKEISVFGVGVLTGDGVDKGDKDTDKEVMDIIDYQELRATAYLPYEMMVLGNEVVSMRGRYRIALHFPDTKMAGPHGFTKIMSSPGGIKAALSAAAAGK